LVKIYGNDCDLVQERVVSRNHWTTAGRTVNERNEHEDEHEDEQQDEQQDEREDEGENHSPCH